MESKEISISVVIPAYNSEGHIGRAVDSVLGQSLTAFEVIVVDDGSTDNTGEIVKDYGDKVQYIYQENAGVSVARNTGIEIAKGNWIAFLDADDEWLKDKLKLQTELLGKNPDLKWAYSNFHINRPDSAELELAHRSSALKKLLGNRESFNDYLKAYVTYGFAWTCTLIINRDVFRKTGMFEPGMKRAQDNDLWFRIAYQYPEIGYVTHPLAVYHMDTPCSSTKINDQVDFMLHLIERQLKISAEFGRQEALIPCITNMVTSRIRQFITQKRYADAKKLLDIFNEYTHPRFHREISFRLICPPLTSSIVDLIFKLKKIINLK